MFLPPYGKMKAHILLAVVCSAFAAIDVQMQCGQLPDGGPCRELFPRWWFDVRTGKCEPFDYGGCGGNENRYETEEECMKTCSNRKSTVQDICRRPVYSGPCLYMEKRFYYDVKTNRCKEFLYGGCNSNGNNFKTLRHCVHFCVRIGGHEASIA